MDFQSINQTITDLSLHLNDVVGWLGTICLTVCSLPQLLLTWKEKNVQGLSLTMIWLWLLGLIFMLIYLWNSTQQMILLVNYGLNVFVVCAILYGYRRAVLYQRKKLKSRKR